MSEAIAFDSYRFVKNLRASGFTEEQAEGLAKEQVHLLDTHLATKADIAAVRADGEQLSAVVQRLGADVKQLSAVVQRLGADVEQLSAVVQRLGADVEQLSAVVQRLGGNLEQVRANVEIKIQESKVDLLKWMITAMIAQGALVVTLVKLL